MENQIEINITSHLSNNNNLYNNLKNIYKENKILIIIQTAWINKN
jgi:hypothetical protein